MYYIISVNINQRRAPMSKQLTIFDEMKNPLYAEIADLEHKIQMEESMLKALDPKDYEDRNEIHTCTRMINGYRQNIDKLQQEIAEYNAITQQLNEKSISKQR